MCLPIDNSTEGGFCDRQACDWIGFGEIEKRFTIRGVPFAIDEFVVGIEIGTHDGRWRGSQVLQEGDWNWRLGFVIYCCTAKLDLLY